MDDQEKPLEPFHSDQMVFCPHCGVPLSPDRNTFADVFAKNSSHCPECGEVLDLWLAIVKHIGAWSAFGGAILLAGAKQITLQTDLVQGRATPIDFKAYGLPPTAEILYLNFTPLGHSRRGRPHGSS
ncbi:MAG TPA: zinc ribbon domain-containing protein [Polyangiales bacterium]